MSGWLITSGPTREYLDPVRFISNASSGRMGRALAQALIDRGQEVTIVSGPVHVEYPASSRVRWVESTQEMLDACLEEFGPCQALIAAAAPCDYRPRQFSTRKLSKTGSPRTIELDETPDILATLGQRKQGRLFVGFALQTEDHLAAALRKLRQKECDYMLVNGPEVLHSLTTSVRMIDRQGQVVLHASGEKDAVAREIVNFLCDQQQRSERGTTRE